MVAKNLGERTNFLSTESIANSEIQASPLARDLPDHISTVFHDTLHDEQEQRKDFFYVISWDGINGTPVKPITVELHKWPGSDPPRLQSEAFLELYQQNLIRYSATPRDLPARFL